MNLQIVIAAAGAFVLVAVLTGTALWWWLTRRSPEQRRLRELGIVAATPAAVAGPVQLSDADLDPILKRLSRLAAKSPKEMSKRQKTLARAGFSTRSAVVYFRLAQLVLPLPLFVVTLLVLGTGNWVVALINAGVGYLLPDLYVMRRTTGRKKAIQNGLADALDLITVCVEAGSGLDQALSKTAEELELAHPELAGEFKVITTEIRAGKARLEAFRAFAQRTGIDDVRSLVSMLTQTDRFGTSVGQALRSHSETIRTKRRQRAEERAAKVSVKMVFPLALCLFPALYVVCFGPVVVRVYHAFF